MILGSLTDWSGHILAGRTLDANEKYSFGKRRQGGKNHENPGPHLKLKPHEGNRQSAMGTVHSMTTPTKSTPVTTLAPDFEYLV